MNFQKIFTIAASALITSSLFAQSFNVTSVEIHERGAWVEHTGVANFSSGTSTVEITGLPTGLVESKIQVEVKPGVYLQKLEYVEKKSENSNESELDNIRDSIHMLNVRKQMFEALKHTLNEEREFLKANRQIGSSQEVLLVDDLIEMADFLRERNQDLGLEILDVELDIKILEEELADLHSRLNRVQNINSGFSRQGCLFLDLVTDDNSKSSSEISIRYLTSDAGWSPEYEVYFEENEVFVKRKANIVQNTGLDFSNAEIVLITGNPTDELSLGEFDPWVIDYDEQEHLEEGVSIRGARSSSTWVYVDGIKVNGGEIPSEFNFASNARYTFSLEGKNIVESGKGRSTVEIDSFILNGDIRYKAAPALNSDSYATVRCSDWLESKLLNGEGRIISGSTYLGDFYLSVPSVGDTLIMPLGTDPHVRCSRELVAENSSSSFLAGKKEMVQTWELTVENAHTDSVEVDLIDNLPITRFKDKGIEISAEASDNGLVDLIKGKVIYPISLAALEKRTVTLTIRVKYPSRHNLQSF